MNYSLKYVVSRLDLLDTIFNYILFAKLTNGTYSFNKGLFNEHLLMIHECMLNFKINLTFYLKIG